MKYKLILSQSRYEGQECLWTFQLLDRSIYEYVTKQWRGSSDSKIANNLEDLERSGSDLFDPVSSQSWNNLIDEMIEKGTIDGDSYVDKLDNKRVKLILYYYYILNSVDGSTDPTLSGIDLVRQCHICRSPSKKY